jgi:hypothetical protein
MNDVKLETRRLVTLENVLSRLDLAEAPHVKCVAVSRGPEFSGAGRKAPSRGRRLKCARRFAVGYNVQPSNATLLAELGIVNALVRQLPSPLSRSLVGQVQMYERIIQRWLAVRPTTAQRAAMLECIDALKTTALGSGAADGSSRNLSQPALPVPTRSRKRGQLERR